MKALITGASSGIGRDMARALAGRGYDLILVARRLDRLEALKQELPVDVQVIAADLSDPDACMRLYETVKNQTIDVLINNAGFGAFGAFDKTPLARDLALIDVNIRAVHMLTKLFLPDMRSRDFGYILNVASSAAFLPGPLLAAYYASKAYVLRLTQSIYGELREEGSNVHICALCPGPVATEFDSVANVRFSLHSLKSRDVANYAIKKMFQKKLTIIPGVQMKLSKFILRFLPDRLIIWIAHMLQSKKMG